MKVEFKLQSFSQDIIKTIKNIFSVLEFLLLKLL